MKKAALLLVLVCVFVSVGFAQLGFSKGIIGGMNIATVSGADVSSDVKSITGYAAGVYLQFSPPGPFAVEAEGLYSMKGSKVDVFGSTSTTNAAYVDIPVLLKFYFPVPVVSPYLCAGPVYSTLLSAKVKTTGILSRETDVKDQMASSDFGLVFGAGLSFSSLRVDARYNMGLSALDKDGNLKMYNRVIALYVGLSL
jgi:outer membrane immunogenic protein